MVVSPQEDRIGISLGKMDEEHKIVIKEIQVFRFNERTKKLQLESKCFFNLEHTSPEFVFNNSDIK